MPFDVTVRVAKLRNLRGEEGTDEPYVMVAFMKLDGTAIRHDQTDLSTPLSADPKLSWVKLGRGIPSPSSVPEGTTAEIPPHVGELKGTLEPIRLQNVLWDPGEPRTYVVPGMLAVVVGVAEEDTNTNEVVTRIQERTVAVAEQAVKGFIESLQTGQLLDPAGDGSIGPEAPGYAATLGAYLWRRFEQDVLPGIRKQVRAIARSEAASEEPWTAVDPDDDLGTVRWLVPSAAVPFAKHVGSVPLPEREVAHYGPPVSEFEENPDSDSWNYHLWGTVAYQARPTGRLVATALPSSLRTLERATRTLESDHGSCGRVGDEIELQLLGAEQAFRLQVVPQDEFRYELVVNGLRVGPAGAAGGSTSGTLRVPGPHAYTWIDEAGGVWDLETRTIPWDAMCSWRLVADESDRDAAFELVVERPYAGHDLRPAFTIAVELVSVWRGESRTVTTEHLHFEGARIGNPVLDCIVRNEASWVEVPPGLPGGLPPWLGPAPPGPDDGPGLPPLPPRPTWVHHAADARLAGARVADWLAARHAGVGSASSLAGAARSLGFTPSESRRLARMALERLET